MQIPERVNTMSVPQEAESANPDLGRDFITLLRGRTQIATATPRALFLSFIGLPFDQVLTAGRSIAALEWRKQWLNQIV
jgi:hypothetical protein